MTSPAPAKIGRNDPCPCGSGKKYKRCCLREQAASYDLPDIGALRRILNLPASSS